MSSYNLLMLPGDGIGPEVINEVERVIEWFNKNSNHKFEISGSYFLLIIFLMGTQMNVKILL